MDGVQRQGTAAACSTQLLFPLVWLFALTPFSFKPQPTIVFLLLFDNPYVVKTLSNPECRKDLQNSITEWRIYSGECWLQRFAIRSFILLGEEGAECGEGSHIMLKLHVCAKCGHPVGSKFRAFYLDRKGCEWQVKNPLFCTWDSHGCRFECTCYFLYVLTVMP